MTIAQAQADVRRVHRGGAMGPLVAGLAWAVASALFTWVSVGASMWALFVGGALIFPLSSLLLKLLGGPISLPPGHPSAALAFQAAMVAPAGTLVAIVLGLFDPDRFLPAAALLIGAHYLVWPSLYGMRIWLAPALCLVVIGLAGLFVVPDLGALAGWATAAVLLAFVVPLYRAGGRRADAPS